MRWINLSFILFVLFSSCKKDPADAVPTVELKSGFLVLNEGLFQQNNSSLSWIDLGSGSVSNTFFESANGRLLGDTGNDLQIYGGKIWVVVNNSNTIEVLSKSTGKGIKQISMVSSTGGKQPRSITFQGKHAYVSCFDGYVDVIDTVSLSVVQRIPVGQNPEGLAISQGRLFVANSGGLNYPDVDSTVSVIDLQTMTEITRVTVGKNPGSVVVDGEGDVYVIARGNYGSVPSRMVRIDPVDLTVQTFGFDASGIARMNDKLLVSFYNYSTQTSAIRLFDALSESLINNDFINTSMITTLYGVHYDPFRDKIYCSDAMSFTNSGYVRQYSSSGMYECSYHVGLNPGKIVFYD